MRFLSLLFISFIALSPAVSVYPKLAGSATAVVTLNWTVDLQGQQVSELQVKTFGFKDYLSQDVLSEETSVPTEIETDSYGNKIRVFRLDNEQQLQSFGMQSKVKVRFPFKYKAELPGEAEHYLKQSAYIGITPEIRQKALELTEGIEGELEKAVALSEWVHDNVEYDSAYIAFSKSASDVYSERRGTCDEFSHLLIALLRAAGIPAKFSASFVYSGSDWGAHAFVEALVDSRWIPFDPTFNEAMLLDATHVKFGEGLDQQDIKEDIVIRSSNADVGRIRLERSFDVQLEDVGNFPPLFSLSLQVPNYTAGENSIETISVTVENGENELAVPLSLNTPTELEVLGANKFNRDKLVLLQPFEKKTVQWKVKLPRLDENLIYLYPVEVGSLGRNVSASFKANKRGEQKVEEELEIPAVSSEVAGSYLKVVASIRNSGNAPAPNVSIALSLPGFSETRSISLGAGEEKLVSFTAPKPSEALVRGSLAVTSDKESFVQPIVVSLEEPSEEPATSGLPAEPISAALSSPDVQTYALYAAAALAILFALSRIVRIRVG